MATALPAEQSVRAINTRIGPYELDKIHNEDCLAALTKLPDDCVDVAITSPPYWGQRGNAGLGSEEDPREYVNNLVIVFREVMRCLKPTGTFWLNIGDSYNTPINWKEEHHTYSSLGPEGKGLKPTNSAYTKNRGSRRAFIDKDSGWLKYGNLLALPYRIIIRLCDEGFLFRGEVIWEKSRPMPEGLCRRPHRRHEPIYIMAKDEGHKFQTKPPIGTVWKLLQTPNLTSHCSTFPLDLPLKCIEASGIEKPAIILDPFMGSGTTAKAAKILGHDFIGFEMNPEFCAIGNKEVAETITQREMF